LQFHYSKTHRIYFLGLLFLQPEIPHNIFIHLLPASEKRFRTALIYARSVFGIGLGPFPALPFLIFWFRLILPLDDEPICPYRIQSTIIRLPT
jgi:hypothetical protein